MKHFISKLLSFFRVLFTFVKATKFTFRVSKTQKGETIIMKINGQTVYINIGCEHFSDANPAGTVTISSGVYAQGEIPAESIRKEETGDGEE